MNLNNNKGFSLIELIVAIGIIGILTTVAIPSYSAYKQSARESVLQSSADAIGKSFSACMVRENDNYNNCNSLAGLKISLGNDGITEGAIESEAANSATENGTTCIELYYDLDGSGDVSPHDAVACILLDRTAGSFVRVDIKKHAKCTAPAPATPEDLADGTGGGCKVGS